MGNKMNKVLPGLYIGSARDARDVEELRENKISHILSVLEHAKPDLPDKEYLCLSIPDSPSQNITCYFSQCIVFIHKARRTGNVLVHCQMGVSRSATIVVAYLMTVTRLSWKNAVAALKAVRPFVSPNLGFQKQLMIYEQKYVEEERTRLKTLFPLSQFNDVVHCEQLLETYRLSRLRNEQPMEVDVYPLALDAYGAKDFASLRRESTPANVVFCGPVSDPISEEDCMVRRLERIHLNETFTSRDTFSCGGRPTSKIIVKTKSPEVNTPSVSSLNDVVQETGSGSREKISANALLSGSLNNTAPEFRPDDSKASDDAALEMLFSNCVDVSKISVNEDAKKDVMQESSSQQSLNDAAVESIFLDSVGGSKNSISKQSSEAKASSREIKVCNGLTEKELRDIGRAYLRKHVRTWHDMSDPDDDDEDKTLPAVKITNNNPTQNKIASNDPTRLIKITGKNPTQNKIASNDPTRLIKIAGSNPTQNMITSNDPSQLKVLSNDLAQLMRIVSNNPSTATITSNDPTEKRLSANSEEVITVLPSKSQLDQLFQG